MSQQRPVWVEGYLVGDTHHPAQLLGLPEGETFQDACRNLLEPLGNFDASTLTYWGRRLFDNESDARAAHG